jgi:hypothetical protein
MIFDHHSDCSKDLAFPGSIVWMPPGSGPAGRNSKASRAQHCSPDVQSSTASMAQERSSGAKCSTALRTRQVCSPGVPGNNSIALRGQDCSSVALAVHSNVFGTADYNLARHHSPGPRQDQVTLSVSGGCPAPSIGTLPLEVGCNHFCHVRALVEQNGTRLAQNHTNCMHCASFDHCKHSG